MPESERAIREPAHYERELQRARAISSALAQHNHVVELLQNAKRDRELTDLPDYDPVIKALETLEVDSGDRLATEHS